MIQPTIQHIFYLHIGHIRQPVLEIAPYPDLEALQHRLIFLGRHTNCITLAALTDAYGQVTAVWQQAIDAHVLHLRIVAPAILWAPEPWAPLQTEMLLRLPQPAELQQALCTSKHLLLHFGASHIPRSTAELRRLPASYLHACLVVRPDRTAVDVFFDEVRSLYER